MRWCMSIKLTCLQQWAIKMSLLPVWTFASALQWAQTQLQPVSVSAVLDAEVLLADLLHVSRGHLHAWPQRELTAEQQEKFSAGVMRCVQGEPIAYVTGHREFWSLDLLVTPATLIPRPETELLVECVLNTFHDHDTHKIADLGTGSGAIALAIATERPQWQVHATDVSEAALAVAHQNAMRLQLMNVSFHQGDWCAALPTRGFDAIVSNPPYIALEDERVEQRVKLAEPHGALFSGEDGLDAIRQIISHAKNFLKSGGYLFIEHGCGQAAMVRCLFEKAGYTKVDLHKDLAGLERVTRGCMI